MIKKPKSTTDSNGAIIKEGDRVNVLSREEVNADLKIELGIPGTLKYNDIEFVVVLDSSRIMTVSQITKLGFRIIKLNKNG